MAEVKVENTKTPVRNETPGLAKSNDVFAPMFPVGRFFGTNSWAMNPWAMNPWAMMLEFSNEMDRMFRTNPATETWAPAVDVRRCNGDMVVTAELPGMQKDEVKVQVTDNALIIEGERKREHKEDHEGYHRFERSYGNFYRAIPLPEGAKGDLAKAELHDGILKVTVPAPAAKNIEEPKKARPIPIETGTTKTAAAA